MIYFFIGAPGSGKDTQAKRIGIILNALVISGGDLLRKEMADGTELGKKIAARMDAGNLIEDEIVYDLYKTEVEESIANNFIITGFPRKISQANDLKMLCLKLGQEFGGVVYIKVSEEELHERLNIRSEDENRGDDDKLEYRLQVFNEPLPQILDIVEKSFPGGIIEINGEGSIEDVTGRIANKLVDRG